MSRRHQRLWLVSAAGQPLVAFHDERAAIEFAHKANEAGLHKAQSPDPHIAPLWHSVYAVELRSTPKAGKA